MKSMIDNFFLRKQAAGITVFKFVNIPEDIFLRNKLDLVYGLPMSIQKTLDQKETR
jgi:hypothetical protein